MMTIAQILCIFTVVTTALSTNEHKANIERREVFNVNPNNGLVGIASVAGITSRNGRVSSLSGIKLFPSIDQPVNVGNTNARPYFYPLSITKESDGKYASNSIQFYPGSVVVSAKSGYGPNIKTWSGAMNAPIGEDIFIQPDIELFNTPQHIEPWFPKDIFKPIIPPRIEDIRNNWIYPAYNPFINLWR